MLKSILRNVFRRHVRKWHALAIPPIYEVYCQICWLEMLAGFVLFDLVATANIRASRFEFRVRREDQLTGTTHRPLSLHLGGLRCSSQVESIIQNDPDCLSANHRRRPSHFSCHRPYRRLKRTKTDSSHRPQNRQVHHSHALCCTLPLYIAVIRVLELRH
jgi:hypothetical protein